MACDPLLADDTTTPSQYIVLPSSHNATGCSKEERRTKKRHIKRGPKAQRKKKLDGSTNVSDMEINLSPLCSLSSIKDDGETTAYFPTPSEVLLRSSPPSPRSLPTLNYMPHKLTVRELVAYFEVQSHQLTEGKFKDIPNNRPTQVIRSHDGTDDNDRADHRPFHRHQADTVDGIKPLIPEHPNLKSVRPPNKGRVSMNRRAEMTSNQIILTPSLSESLVTGRRLTNSKIGSLPSVSSSSISLPGPAILTRGLMTSPPSSKTRQHYKEISASQQSEISSTMASARKSREQKPFRDVQVTEGTIPSNTTSNTTSEREERKILLPSLRSTTSSTAIVEPSVSFDNENDRDQLSSFTSRNRRTVFSESRINSTNSTSPTPSITNHPSETNKSTVLPESVWSEGPVFIVSPSSRSNTTKLYAFVSLSSLSTLTLFGHGICHLSVFRGPLQVLNFAPASSHHPIEKASYETAYGVSHIFRVMHASKCEMRRTEKPLFLLRSASFPRELLLVSFLDGPAHLEQKLLQKLIRKCAPDFDEEQHRVSLFEPNVSNGTETTLADFDLMDDELLQYYTWSSSEIFELSLRLDVTWLSSWCSSYGGILKSPLDAKLREQPYNEAWNHSDVLAFRVRPNRNP